MDHDRSDLGILLVWEVETLNLVLDDDRFDGRARHDVHRFDSVDHLVLAVEYSLTPSRVPSPALDGDVLLRQPSRHQSKKMLANLNVHVKRTGCAPSLV